MECEVGVLVEFEGVLIEAGYWPTVGYLYLLAFLVLQFHLEKAL